MHPDPPDSFPTFRRLAKFFRRRGIPAIRSFSAGLGRIFFSQTSVKVYLATATLITLFYTGSRWYGRRLLLQEKQRIAALGMATEWSQLTTPQPPAQENFLASPPFEGVFGDARQPAPQLALWLKKTDVATRQPNGSIRVTFPSKPKNNNLEAWCAFFRRVGTLPPAVAGKSAAEELLSDEGVVSDIKAILEAAKRPAARFPSGASDSRSPSIYSEIPLTTISYMTRCLTLYGLAKMEAGLAEEALPVFRVTDNLAQAYFAESGLFYHICANGMLQAQSAYLREGLIRHSWPAELLTRIMGKNYPALLQASGQRAQEADRLAITELLEHYDKTILPLREASQWQHILWEYIAPDYYYINAGVLNSKFYEWSHAGTAPLGPMEFWADRKVSQPRLPTNFGPVGVFAPFSDPKPYLFRIHAIPIMHATLQHLAAALELEFLTHGRYPAELANLDDKLFTPKVSLLDIDGKPIRYTTDAAGSWFILRSVGATGLPHPADAAVEDIVFSTAPGTDPK
ncbi:MAG: hypothetical protein JWL81_3338 [Verrucomicrobiales bacterium]|nr:hypothetical protein [Verrucomicrobiales bacterium]